MQDALATYFSLMTMNGNAHVFKIAAQMGIFNAFKSGQKTAKTVAEELKCLEGPTQLMCEALVGLGTLEKKGEAFGLSPVMHLLSGNYQNLSSEYWEHFPTFMKTGTPFKRMDAVEDSEKEYQVQVKALEWMMGPCAQLAAEHLAKDGFTGPIRVLDVGCGSAVWGLALLKKNAEAKATLVDWPAVLKVARASAEEHGLTSRATFIEGNFHQSDFGREIHDIAILANVTHIETPEGCQKLFQKIAERLRPGGALVIHDVYGEDPRGEMARWLYRLGLAVRTVQGKVHMPEEMRPWLESAGFKTTAFRSLDVVPYSMGTVIAWKK
jgi:ubiquinone/menaquinone biosynthesis C-methylase UbiE